MTIDQFRTQTPYVQRMRELLSDPTMQEALTTLLDSNRPKQLLDGAEVIASVRAQSQQRGYDCCLSDLLRLAEPIMPPPVPEETSYEPEA